MRKPELLAPGGSFLSAFHAIEAGADGVYLGMKDFSARKAARNFTLTQLRRIRGLAADRGRRLYVTVNTVIREAEAGMLAESLAWLEALGVDGVIVQDLGTVDVLRRRFPGIPIHASTQMAIHNAAGLQIAKEMGIRRVILSRELPLERIRALRAENPDIELEVFIHGALCYSFSGICLASWAVAGRSGNRGDCAQICRSLFRGAPGTGARGEEGHFFSCRDLSLGRDVLELAKIGIDALKIEGRMKSPEYVFNTTRLYREILDRGPELPEGEYAELARRAEVSFSRETSRAFFRSPHGSRLIDTRHPGHRGSVLGTVESVRGREIGFRLRADLSLRDGLGWFPGENAAPVVFSVQRLARKGREASFARSGEPVTVEVPPEAGPVPRKGTEIRQLSSRFLDLPQPKEAGFPPYKVPVDLTVTLEEGEGGARLSALAVRFPLRAGSGDLPPRFLRPVTLDKAAQRRPFSQVLRALLEESGDSLFRLGSLAFANRTRHGDDEIFVPPSELKKAKNELFAHLDTAFLSAVASAASEAGEIPAREPSASAAPSAAPSALTDDDRAALAHRERLAPPGCAPVPFACGDPREIRVDDLARACGFSFLPLPPVILDESGWLEAVPRLVEENPETRFAIGLNNVAHLAFTDALAAKANAWFFADFSLYVANAGALRVLHDRVPRMLFAYSWIEGDAEDHRALAERAPRDTPLIGISRDFRPPLFYSLGCFARHVMNSSECFDGCSKDFARVIRQGRNVFEVVVRDCVTYLFSGNPAA